MTSRLGARRGAYLLFFFSGATSLVYEVLWLRQLILVLGSTLFATSAILASFMGGLAIGSFAAGRILDRRRASPLRIYGLLEIAIGIYALAVPALFRSMTPLYALLWSAGGADSFWLFSLAKFAGTLLVLLPPTILMGASLPVLASQVADDPLRIGGKVGSLYAVNTFGAVAGTFFAGFVAIPWYGVRATTWAAAIVNLVVGTSAVLLARSVAASGLASTTPGPGFPRRPERRTVVMAVFAVSGGAAMALEVAWTRGLSLILGSSVYAFSLMLLAFLTGLAAGSAACSAWLRRRPGIDAGRGLALCLASAGVLAYLTAFLFPALPRAFGFLYFGGRLGPNAWLAAEFVFGVAVMFPATLALGGIFPLALQVYARDAGRVGGAVGEVYAANTMGTIVGSIAAGFVVIPLIGVRDTLVAVSATQILLGLVVVVALVPAAGLRRWKLVAPMLATAAWVVAVRPPWDLILMNSGVYYNIADLPYEATWNDFLDRTVRDHRIVFYREGLTASVMVADQPASGNRYLAVNGKVEASTGGDMETQTMCAQLPLLLHPAPRDVLVVGLASGITVGSAASHPVRSIRVIEIESAMVPAARCFARANGDVLEDPRVKVSINDARNELTFSDRRYDVIVSEPSNPWMTVASNLFTEEFFRLARERLLPGGIFCQWCQTYGLATDDLRSVVAAFKSSFPHSFLFETFEGTDILLLGSDRTLALDMERIASRMSELKVRMDLARVGTRRPADILPLFRMGDAEIDRWIAGADRNNDDNARVEFSAPRAMYEDTSDATLERIAALSADPLTYVEPPPGSAERHDRLRLAFAQACLARGQKSRAGRIATPLLEGPAAADARKLLEKL